MYPLLLHPSCNVYLQCHESISATTNFAAALLSHSITLEALLASNPQRDLDAKPCAVTLLSRLSIRRPCSLCSRQCAPLVNQMLVTCYAAPKSRGLYGPWSSMGPALLAGSCPRRSLHLGKSWSLLRALFSLAPHPGRDWRLTARKEDCRRA